VAAKPPEPRKADPAKPDPEKKPAPEKKPEARPQVAAAEPARPTPPPPRLTGAALNQKLEKVGVLQVLAALDADTKAATAAAVGPDGIRQTAAEALDGASHVGLQTGDRTIDRKDNGPIITQLDPLQPHLDPVREAPAGPIRRQEPKDPGCILPKLPPGSPDQELVARFVRMHLGALKACYEAELKRNHELGGRLKVRFTVNQVGDVSDAEVEEDGLHSLAVSSCITRRIENWHLAAHLGEDLTVSFPFIFAHE
jgi:hypothetical protein